ncbi:MAG: hypothetical protein SOY26_00445 [Paludibacteraceae bacterium]|nr:hypothetical protein [Bacteroidales bacterium]MDY4148203.1 hypothetical protein [Paludibacteraceae bacterium]
MWKNCSLPLATPLPPSQNTINRLAIHLHSTLHLTPTYTCICTHYTCTHYPLPCNNVTV